MKAKKKRLAYYITPHGFGHAVRSLEVIRHMLKRAPNWDIHIVSTIPGFLIKQNSGKSLPLKKKRLDIGLIQRDSLQFDLEATRQALERLFQNRNVLLSAEMQFLENQEILGVVSDVPFLPFVASSKRGIPAIGIGNFTWDWIYQAYATSDPRWNQLVSWIRESYQKCSLFLQLPMHGDCSACPEIQDVPLVARISKRNRKETRHILKLASDQRVYLVSFTTLELDEVAQKNVQAISDTVFVYKHPLRFHFENGICLDKFPLSYTDVVAAVDGVITKPGYGIVSECLAHGTPIIYTDRGLFPEYDILVQEMKQYLNVVYLSSPDLYAGRWKSAIRELHARGRPATTLPCNGAEICAQTIMSFID